MFTNMGPSFGQFEAGALASVIGSVGATAVGLLAAGLATVASVRRFEVCESAPTATGEAQARA
jgi:hypothetical protein